MYYYTSTLMMTATKKQKYLKELIGVFQKIAPNKRLLEAFLEDLLTKKEHDDIVVRWQIVKKLAQGVPQRKISKDLNVSIATITRGSREMQDEKGGFRRVLRRIYKNNC